VKDFALGADEGKEKEKKRIRLSLAKVVILLLLFPYRLLVFLLPPCL
jgi:hypothetical protein